MCVSNIGSLKESWKMADVVKKEENTSCLITQIHPPPVFVFSGFTGDGTEFVFLNIYSFSVLIQTLKFGFIAFLHFFHVYLDLDT